MDWLEVTVETTSLASEMVANTLEMAGAAGAAIEDKADLIAFQQNKADWDYIDDELVNAMADEVRVKVYFPDDARLADTLRTIQQSLNDLRGMNLGFDLGSLAVRTQGMKEEDWANNWKKYYKPFAVGEKLWIRPVWEPDTAPAGRKTLVMDPGMAFGTGTHETTYLCMELLQQTVTPGMKLYDVGCGTGILGIAALLLGAGHAIAIDRDPVCVDAVKNNRALNGLADTRIPAKLGNLLDGETEKRPLIVANIIADVIIGMLPQVKEHLELPGTFIASGIIKAKEDEVTAALKENGFVIRDIRRKGEWVAILSTLQ